MNVTLKKRDCGMRMKLVPYGAGWTDVHLDIEKDSLYFVISYVWGDCFSKLLEALYYLHPDQKDPQGIEGLHPCKAEFEWDEEGASSHWLLTRDATATADFDLHIDLTVHRKEVRQYAYTVRYKDFCYAVAKACTETLKSHGIYGYHHSTYEDDIPLRYLLFIKSVALENDEARTLTYHDVGKGESTSFEKEIELLLFDM